MALAFEQQPKESDKAFAAFSLYLSLGPERSLIGVAKTLNKDKRLMITWSKRYNWSARVQAYETHISQSGSAALNPLPALTVAAAKALDTAQLYHQPSTFSPDREPSPARSTSVPSTINNQPSTTMNPQLPDQPSSPSVSSVISCKIPSPMPWDQQPGETNKNFATFTTYLALGPGRSLSKTAQATGRTKDQLAHWSHRWRWRARAAAYHAHLAAVERRATEDLVAAKSRDWAAMHEGIKRQAWAEAEDLILLAQDFKARWRDSERLPDFGALIRALELAFKLKQFAAGMPSEIKEVNTTVTGTVEIEWEAALRKAYGPKPEPQIIDVEEAPSAPKPELANPGTPPPNPEP